MTNRALKDCLLVDNLAYSYSATPAHGVLIKPFLGPGSDEELLFLLEALDKWHSSTPSNTFIDTEFNQRVFLDYLLTTDNKYYAKVT